VTVAIENNRETPILRWRKAMSFLMAACVLSLTCPAQQSDLTDKSLEELSNMQVYSASKHMQSASEAPSSITVVTAEDIQKYGYRTLAEILESVRGFYITYDRDYTFVGVRGFGRLGDWNSRILLLIDGHRINDNVLGNGMIGSEFPVDVDLIERVEIIRGPSSSLYGDNAFFAVINVITRKPRQLNGAELSFQPGSFGTYEGRASYGGQYRGLGMLLSGTFYSSSGQTLFFPHFDTPGNNNGITTDTDYESYQHILATLTFGHFTVQGLFSNRDREVPTGYYGAVFNDPRTKNVDVHQYFDVSYERMLGKNWDLMARTSYDQSRLQGPVVYTTGIPADPTFVNTYSFRGNWWDSEIKLTRTLFEKHKITLGSEVLDNVRQDQGDYTSNDNVFIVDPGSSLIWALYGQDEFAVTSKLTLSGGLRYDHYSDFRGSTNPRLGLIYRLFVPTTVKLLYGTAFRAPEPFELTPDFGIVYDDNLNLQPETIRSQEVVIEQGIGKHFTLSGNLFRNDIDRLISLEPVADGQLQYQNVQSVVAKGVEIELDGRAQSGLQGSASYGFTHPSTGQLDLLANSPQHLAKLNVSVPVIQKRLFASMDAQYTSPRQTLLGDTVSGFSIFNVSLLGHTLGKHLDVSAGVYNLLDKKYFDPGRPEDPENTIQQDGRSFRIKLTARFGKR